MIKKTALLLAVLLAINTIPAPAFSQSIEKSLTPKQILDKVDDLWRGESSYGKINMTITTEHWSRSLTLEAWSKGKDRSLIKILSPKKEKGTATLRYGNNIWNYLPKVKRVIKLPSSMMASAWMGSHFTNDDLVKESRMADDYTFTITFDGEKNRKKIVEVTCIPNPEAAVVWGKVVVIVDRVTYLPLTINYYDEDMNLARIMTFMDVGPLGGKDRPRRMSIVPADNSDESTTVHYSELEFNPDISDALFSIRSLQK